MWKLLIWRTDPLDLVSVFWIMRLISGFACNTSRSGLFPVPMATQFTFLLSSSRQKGASRLHSFPKRTEKLSREIKLGKETHQTQNSVIQYGRGVAPCHTTWNIHRIYWCNATNYIYIRYAEDDCIAKGAMPGCTMKPDQTSRRRGGIAKTKDENCIRYRTSWYQQLGG